MEVFLFTATILSMKATAAIVCILCRHAKLKSLLTGIAFQPIRETDVIFGSNNENKHCKCNVQWYTIAVLAPMIIGLTLFILVTKRKCGICRRKLFSNTVTVMLFFSDGNQYVTVKLCKTAGSIHLLKIFGHPDQITLEGKLLWDVIKIDWKEVFMTLNRTIINLPASVIIPLRDKFRLRHIMRKKSLLLHVMLRQGMSWYALDSKEYLLPLPCLDDSEI